MPEELLDPFGFIGQASDVAVCVNHERYREVITKIHEILEKHEEVQAGSQWLMQYGDSANETTRELRDTFGHRLDLKNSPEHPVLLIESNFFVGLLQGQCIQKDLNIHW